jgi:rRNA-processing protein FCF1
MSLSGLIIDTCGWIALVDAKINLDIALKPIVGQPELLVTDSVLNELKKIDDERKGLLLGLLISRSRVVNSNYSHTDDGLLRLSGETGFPVLTVDRDLKRRLVSSGCSYVEVTAGRTLRLVA